MSGPRPVDPEDARQEARAAGFEPLAPYPGRTGDQWMHQCMTCGVRLHTPLARIRLGWTCKHREMDFLKARVKVVLDTGFDLVDEAPLTTKERIPVHCRRCGEISRRSVEWMKRNTCPCAKRDGFVAEMRAAGLDPQEPYPGTSRHPWKSVCRVCGQERWTNLDTVRVGKRCKHRT